MPDRLAQALLQRPKIESGPDPLTPEQRELLARLRQRPRGPVGSAVNRGLERLGSFMSGLTGLPSGAPGVSPGAPDDQAQAIGEGVGMLAGLPFASVMRNLGKVPKVYRGTTRLRETYDPNHFDRGDILGWMFHAAEDPRHAARFTGFADFDERDVIDSGVLPSLYGRGDTKGRRARNPGTQSFFIENKNSLDLVDRDPVDIVKAIRAMPERSLARDSFDRYSTGMRSLPTEQLAKELTDTDLRLLAMALRQDFDDPMKFYRTGHDALRYRDLEGYTSWGIPPKTMNQLRVMFGDTPSSVYLNRDRIVKSDPYPNTQYYDLVPRSRR